MEKKHEKKKKKIKNLLAYKTTYFFPRTLVILSQNVSIIFLCLQIQQKKDITYSKPIQIF